MQHSKEYAKYCAPVLFPESQLLISNGNLRTKLLSTVNLNLIAKQKQQNSNMELSNEKINQEQEIET